MSTYGQFCPVAKAMELLDERWTLLVIRELGAGSQHFNELRRGLPRMSPALLSKRLRTLTRAGIVDRVQTGNRISYLLTPAGKELGPIVDALGVWATRWIPDLADEDLDPRLLMWDLHRNLDHAVLPRERTAFRFTFRDVAPPSRDWWLITHEGDADVCDFDPGLPVLATVESDLRTLTHVWRGDLGWREAMRAERIRLHGPAEVRRLVPRLLKLSPFAEVERPEGHPALVVVPRGMAEQPLGA